MRSDTVLLKNPETGNVDVIRLINWFVHDWGETFYVENGISAYKVAYAYSLHDKTAKVEFVAGWRVTVFNARASEMKLDGAK